MWATGRGGGRANLPPGFIRTSGRQSTWSLFPVHAAPGLPASQISILTTYNGQKQLIRDVVERRCAQDPLFGRPSKIDTVDKFQGQQNDYILLSLVRTPDGGPPAGRAAAGGGDVAGAPGAVRVLPQRPLASATSCSTTFQQLLQRPNRLALLLGEDKTPTVRPRLTPWTSRSSRCPPAT